VQSKIAEDAARLEETPVTEATQPTQRGFDLAPIKAKVNAGIQAVAALWAKVVAWLSSAWAAFVDWTSQLGVHVKNVFFKDDGRRP
jgi:hypothetical protein